MSKNQKPGTGVSNKRRRELASAKYERQSARRAERAARKRRNERIGWTVAALVGVAVIAGVLWWTTSPSDDLATPGTSASPSASPSTADIGCDPAPTPPTDPESWDAAPAMALQDGENYSLTVATNCGEIVIDTKDKKAPKTVNSMLWLAEKGFDPMYGARPLKRLVQKEIGDALARLILRGEVHDGEHVVVSAREDGTGLDLSVVPEPQVEPDSAESGDGGGAREADQAG